MEHLKKLNLLDLENNMSITNIMVLIALIVVCIFPSIPMSLVFLVSVANYCHKRFETSRYYYEEKKFSDLNMVALENQMNALKKDHETVNKLAEETRRMLSERNLAKGFTGRGQRQ